MDPSNDSNSSSTDQLEKYHNDYIAGSCFLITSLLSLSAYAFVLPTIALSKQVRYPCYYLMFSLGVTDCASLIGWSLIGIHTVTHGLILPDWLIRHSLCVLCIGWGSLTVHIAALAINRFLAVCYPEKHDEVFSKRNVYVVIGLCWAYVFCFHSVPTFLPPHMAYSVDGYVANWENPKITAYYFVQDLCAVSVVSALDLTCYTSIIVKYRKMQEQFAVLPTDVVEFRIRQFRLAVQCMVRCFAFFFCDLLYYIFGYVILVDNFWFNFICSTYLWHINNVLSPLVYLIFDNQLRREVRKLLRRVFSRTRNVVQSIS